MELEDLGLQGFGFLGGAGDKGSGGFGFRGSRCGSCPELVGEARGSSRRFRCLAAWVHHACAPKTWMSEKGSLKADGQG